MHIQAIANGLGGQSVYLFYLACLKKVPATVSITADTGWEDDCLWSTGERTPAKDYYERIIVPMGKRYGIETYFVRAVDGKGEPLPSLRDATIQQAEFLNETGKNCLKIPLYGSRDGQLRQSCTQRYKITALNQQLRRLGAKTARTAQGLHVDEFMRRAKGIPLGRDADGHMVFQTGKYDNVTRQIDRTDLFGTEKVTITEKVWRPMKWLTHCYPLVTMKLNREAIRQELEKLDIPYLLSTECDGCPHKDAARWQRTSEETKRDLIQIESRFNGEFFLTNQRIPLEMALAKMDSAEVDNDFGCENDVCGI